MYSSCIFFRKLLHLRRWPSRHWSSVHLCLSWCVCIEPFSLMWSPPMFWKFFCFYSLLSLFCSSISVTADEYFEAYRWCFVTSLAHRDCEIKIYKGNQSIVLARRYALRCWPPTWSILRSSNAYYEVCWLDAINLCIAWLINCWLRLINLINCRLHRW